MKTAAFLATFAFFLAGSPAWAGPVGAVSSGRIIDAPLHAPSGAPKALVIYLSDRTGWTPADDANVEAMRADGSAVLAVDFSRYAAALDADPGVCLSVANELAGLALDAERRLGLQTYLPPIVVGAGEGATFAYAAIKNAPGNRFGGAVALGFANRLALRLPVCPGAAPGKGGFVYGFDTPLLGPATLLVDPTDLDTLAAQASAQAGVTAAVLDHDDVTGQLAKTVGDLTATARPFGDLPVTDLPARQTPKGVAVIVTGDGGWRDIDQTIGGWLADQGVHVVGLDALHYFWSQRTPRQLAEDLTAVIASADPGGSLPVTLIGYSFGADTIPFAFPLMPEPLQDRTRLIALLGPGRTTSFQVTVSGFLGSSVGGYEIAPAIAALPKERVLCVYGADDKDAVCPDPALDAVPKLQTAGGHHFDGDYRKLAETIWAAAQ